jgi:CRP-like cAMP-binding protein
MNTLWGNIFRNKGVRTEQDRVVELLQRIPLFEGLSPRELANIERILHRRTYQAEENIFRQGEPGMGMYIIEEGRVAITAEPSGNLLAELTEGEFFGELALLDDSPRSASARAATECKALGFFQPDLFGLLERNPKLGIKIVLQLARMVGERLKRTNEQLEAVHHAAGGGL